MNLSRSHQWLVLIALFALNLALRLPAFFHELPPWTFCDEDLMVDYAFRMLREHNMNAFHFMSGGVNFYLPVFLGKVAEFFTSSPLSPAEFRILARVATAGILSSATIFWIYKIVQALGGTFVEALVAIAIFTFSPMILGVSRYHYPDHYMVFFVTAALYAIVRLKQTFSTDVAARKRYLWAGLSVGLMCSVKYSGFLLYLLMGFAAFLNLLLEWRESPRKPLAVLWNYVTLVLYATAAAALTFVGTNPSMFRRWELFKEGLMVKHYGPAESLLPGIKFYSEVLYLTFFGVLGVLAFLWGVREFLRRDKFMSLIFLVLPLGIPLFFSRYNLLYNRNVILASPFVIIMSGFGLAAILRSIGTEGWKKVWLAFGICIFFAEPIYRDFYSYRRDFQTDSRLQAKDWISENLYSHTVVIDSNSGCGYPKIAANKSQKTCVGYVALDNWFGGVDSFGKVKTGRSLANLLREPDYKTYHFIAEPMYDVSNVNIGPHYSIIRKFDGAGPKVFLFKNSECDGPTELSRFNEPASAESTQ